ncbi:hypothetical protein DSL64_26920 [Dyadobacter luteus]|jgi:tetratricopeptide (TPR) repeat protein|uniref:RagB/SusD family nutrient uptake outer membrane protein n=1 Tax=Dyadobacter luteus TaxID=2259619 RepID=A0A3D8Y367_9BACT|nr:RagB/SusD family nutrient uptake outer membrane protein [Dyadobacter luteus]REA56430.1 hypothetical protein DSL64_26920 [Dyadobacter luteus]
MKKRPIYIILILALSILGFGCQDDFLEEKPRKSLLVPQTLADYQALLGNGFQLMNTSPYHTVLSDGDFTLTDAFLANQNQLNRSTYLWSSDEQRTFPGWDTPYKQIFTANVVLDGLMKMDEATMQTATYDQLKGGALFYRSLAFYNLAQQFSTAYDPKGANNGPGIVLPLRADINQTLPRASIRQTYDQIIGDLKLASELLENEPVYLSRPSKAAAFALLSRVYLAMQDYPESLSYAELCLKLKSELLDYNTLSTTANAPFPLPFSVPNPEILYFSEMPTSLLGNPAVRVDSDLFDQYQKGDLRKVLYFSGSQNFKGSYTGTLYPFSGISVDEVYLNKAECLARLQQMGPAMDVLNKLLQKRWRMGDFKAVSAATEQQAVSLILAERRKQLIGRGLRWTDLKRLNQDPEYAVTLSRTIAGEKITLLPNASQYQFKIPQDQISFGTVEQNP